MVRHLQDQTTPYSTDMYAYYGSLLVILLSFRCFKQRGAKLNSPSQEYTVKFPLMFLP